MPKIIETPARIEATADRPRSSRRFAGRINSATEAVSVARMVSPSGWSEPGQTPEFDEATVVLRGELKVESHAGVHQIPAGQAIIVKRGEWVRYSTPSLEGAEYIAVSCRPSPRRSCIAIRTEVYRCSDGVPTVGRPPLDREDTVATKCAHTLSLGL